ncbi:MAG: hypothetical protein OEW11_06200 [Nitrospirota bacterium]|nr:hypothetical protein [Nitrospirota bacterium]
MAGDFSHRATRAPHPSGPAAPRLRRKAWCVAALLFLSQVWAGAESPAQSPATPSAGTASDPPDMTALRQNIMGTSSNGAVPRYDLRQIAPPPWEVDDAWLSAHRHEAVGAANRELTGVLEEWAARGSVLTPLERLRHRDFGFGGSGADGGAPATAAPATPEAFGMRLRLGETVRLRVQGAGLTRDLMYDPLSAYMWMDLYRLEFSDGNTGLSLTNSYLLDEDVARVLFTLRHRFR